MKLQNDLKTYNFKSLYYKFLILIYKASDIKTGFNNLSKRLKIH